MAYVGTVQGKPTTVPANRPGGGGNGLDISGGGEGGYIVIDPETSPDNMVNKAAADDALSIAFLAEEQPVARGGMLRCEHVLV